MKKPLDKKPLEQKPHKPQKPFKPREEGQGRFRKSWPSQEEEEEVEPQSCQHIRILDCDKPVSRIFLECYHCQQGLLCECDGTPPIDDIDVPCPVCGKTAIKLVAKQVISTTVIPSPWSQ